MFCKNCGNEISENAKFCKKCGKEILKTEGVKLDSVDKNEPSEVITENIDKGKKKKTKKKKHHFIFKLFIILIVILGIIILLDYLGVIEFPYEESLEKQISKEEIAENVDFNVNEVEIEHPDADAYYEENAKLINSYSVLQSEDVLTEEAIENILKERGFIDYPIYFEYSMDGEYKKATETSGLDEKHPIYQTYYITENNEIWTIIVINDSIVANPVTYNMQDGVNVQVVFAESDTITSYDSVTNKFYESIPNESEVIVKKINKIEASSLEELTVEVIGQYE